ncbi:MAG: type II toxin-antitoxin system RelE/ParE family toxin [Vicinamibacterales bacterium]
MPKLLWGLAIGPAAADFIEGMQPGKTRKLVVKRIRALQGDPHPAGHVKLAGTKNGDEDVWRVRQGDYRILYVIRENEVVVTDVDHRKDVYR